MQALIVGADHLGAIPATLAEFGISVGHHVTGRNPVHQRSPKNLKGMEVVILFTDFLNHNTMRNYRDLAQHRQLPCVACRRSSADLIRTLERLGAKRQLQ